MPGQLGVIVSDITALIVFSLMSRTFMAGQVHTANPGHCLYSIVWVQMLLQSCVAGVGGGRIILIFSLW